MSLKPLFAKYSNRDRAEQDCQQFLQKYRFEVSTVPDRDKQTVVLGNGTIPVMFNGVLYNIPIAIQLPINYPNAAPNVRVKPTTSMVLNSRCNYMIDGVVLIDYLTTKWRASNSLLGLVPELQKAFGSNVPVFAKPNPVPAGSNTMPHPYAPTPSYLYGPPPTSAGGSSIYTAPTPGSSYPATTHTPYPPSNPHPQPPYPSQPAYNPYPQPGYPSNPPYPYPSTQSPFPYPSYQPNPVTSAGYPPPPVTSTGYPPPPVTSTGYPPAPVTATGYPPSNVATSTYQQSPNPTPTPNNGLSATQNEALLKDSLISALREKIGRRIAERRDVMRIETQSVTESLSSLQNGATQLDGALTRLADEERRAVTALNTLRERNEALNKTIAAHDNTLEMNMQPDDMVQPSKPLYKQLAEAYAEEQALEDAMYHLSSALRDQVVDLDSFMKDIRALARRQFTARYIVMKCRERAGLPSV